jgi:hypothetical protein
MDFLLIGKQQKRGVATIILMLVPQQAPLPAKGSPRISEALSEETERGSRTQAEKRFFPVVPFLLP